MRAAILAFATSRMALGVACYICLRQFPAHPILYWQTDLFPGHDWINGWFRWDSFWYLEIADRSTDLVPAGYSAANFFPFYSWVSILVSLPFRVWLAAPQAFGVGALLVSNVAFFLALLGVHRLASSLAGQPTADRAMWLIAWFPFSFFLSAAYSDALYFCLAVWAFVFARDRRWLLASALAAAAAMTRIPGVLVGAAIVLEYARQEGVTPRSLARAIAPAAVLAIAPIVLAGYFWSQFGHPLAFLQARQAGWGRATGPVAALARDVNNFFAGPALDCEPIRDCVAKFNLTRHVLGVWYVSLIVISLGLVLAGMPVVGASLTFWVVGSVLMAMTNGLDGTGRFTVVLFPVFIAAAARLHSMRSVAAVCAGFAPFLMLFLFQFARWRPVL